MKKIITIVLAMVMVLSLCTLNAFAAEDYEVDLSAAPLVGGSGGEHAPHGYPGVDTLLLGYGNVVTLGNLNLGDYSACEITYATDLGYVAQKEGMKIPANFSLKSNNVCIGAATQDPQNDGLLAQADCIDVDKENLHNPSGSGWGQDERVCTIDLTNVDYSGEVWLTHFNSTGNEALVVGIKFVAKEEQSAGGLRSFDSAKGDKLSYDQILVNGAEIANGNDAVIAAKTLVDGSDGSISTIAMHGWFGNANSKIVSYGYTIDGGEPVYGDFAVAAEQDVINAGGESRYTVSVDVTGLQDGENHEIWVVVKLENGDIVKLDRYDNRGQEGAKDREVYVIYKAPKTEAPSTQPDTQPETQQPQTGDAAVAMFAVLAILAMGAVVVFAKKRSF